jgi:hypothetical protein
MSRIQNNSGKIAIPIPVNEGGTGTSIAGVYFPADGSGEIPFAGPGGVYTYNSGITYSASTGLYIDETGTGPLTVNGPAGGSTEITFENNGSIALQLGYTAFDGGFVAGSKAGDFAFRLLSSDTNAFDFTCDTALIDFQIVAGGAIAGFAGTNPGFLKIASNNVNGTVAIQNPSATTAYNFNLPATVGTSGQFLTSQGGGSTPMIWSTLTPGTGTTVVSSGGTTTIGLTLTNLTDVGTDGITVTNGTNAVIGTSPVTISQHVADATHNGYLDSSDWSTFNNKLDKSAGSYITNSDFEVNTAGWNLYNNSGNPAQAYVVNQDITYTAVATGNAGNGINIEYIFHATQSYTTPLVTVVSPTLITVAWYNGPAVANNPTATQIQTAYNAVPGAVALATLVITGSTSKLQYENGSNITANGGDTAPITGTGGTPSGVTFTQNTSTPLVGTASGDLGKIAASEQGQGVSTDFIIDAIDKNQTLQISFAYSGSSGMVLGSSSDVRVFVYDIGNSVLIPVTPVNYLAGPVSTPETFTGEFKTSSSSNYRLILHIATTNATAWDLLIDDVVVTDIIEVAQATSVPVLMIPGQLISGSVTDHMCVMWQDGASHWVPATIAGAALPVYGDDRTQLGFATNIVGSLADIYIQGALDGFSFGPFTGYEQYIDNTAGAISPLPSPFTDLYVMVGMAISSTTLNIQFTPHVDLISNGSGVPLKGGLLSSSAVNDGTGDLVLSVGTNGNVLVANSGSTLGLEWAPAVVVAAPFTYTTATRTLSLNSETANTFLAAPNGSPGVPTFRAIVAADIPTLNQNTTGSAATLTTARTIAGTSFNGSANITLANKFIVQGTTDTGLSNAQFLGALATGIVKNTTTTGVLSIAVAGDFPTLNQSTTGNAATVTTNANLTGDVTSVGNATTLATVNVNVGSFGSSTSIPSFTVNAKGLITAASGNVVIAPAGTLSGTTLNSTVVTSSLTSVGTITTGTWTGTAIAVAHGGTGSTTAAAALTALGAAPTATPTFTGDVNSSTGNVLISTIGKGLEVKTGTNAKIGTAVLAAGTNTVLNSSVTANSRIFVTSNTDGGTPGWLRVSAKTVGTSFVITSSSATDTSTVAWMIVESIP